MPLGVFYSLHSAMMNISAWAFIVYSWLNLGNCFSQLGLKVIVEGLS